MKKLIVIVAVLTVLVAGLVSGENYLFTNFTSGILSRKMDARVDFEKTFSGVRQLENMLVYPQGGVYKRPGLKYVSGVSNSNETVRLIPFVFSTEQAYVIEVGNGYARFYMDEGPIYSVDSYTKLMLHMDGNDASTTFKDSGVSTVTMTANGNAQIDTYYYKFGGASGIFDGAGDYVSTADSDNWNYGTDEFTIDTWVRFAEASNIQTIYLQEDTVIGSGIWLYEDFEEGKCHFVVVDSGTAVINQSFSWSPDVDTWYHFAIVRGWGSDSDDWAVVINGTAAATFTDTSGVTDYDETVRIGGGLSTDAFIDYATYSRTPTIGNSASHSTSQHKWYRSALYFSSSDQYASYPDSSDWDIGTNFTIDLWVKHTDHAGEETYVGQYEDGNNTWRLEHDNGVGIRFRIVSGGTDVVIVTGAEITDTSWHHVALCKVGNEYGVYLDGVQGGYVSDADMDTFAGALYLASRGGVDTFFDGYEDEVRIYNGNPFGAAPVAGLTDTITVPTGPYTTDANMLLLVKSDTGSFNGWMDEYRISKGIARWTANFSPPQIRYPNQLDGGGGGIYQVTMPYNEEQLPFIKYTQSADYLYLANPYVVPYTLTRSDHDSWTASQFYASGSTPWSSTTGYPSSVEFHEERLAWSGTTVYPQRIWMSKSGDYTDYTSGATDDFGVDITIAASEVNAIRWMLSGKVLALGTTGGEWSIGPLDSTTPLTPSNIQAKRQTNYGSANIQAVSAGKQILHVQYGAKKLREYEYSWESDSYKSTDLLILADELTESTTIKEMALQKTPDTILWCVLENGNMLALTYLKDQKIYAWSKITTTGSFENVAVIPGPNNEDQVWVVVRRLVDGTYYRFVEFFEKTENITLSDSFYVDAGLTYDGSGTTTVSGLNHLSGETVEVLADGAYAGQFLVDGDGEITLNTTASKVQAGLAYSSILETIDLPVGTGMERRISVLTPGFYRSCQGQWGSTTSDLDTIDFASSGTTPFTGYIDLAFPGGWSKEQTILFQSSEPLPFAVSGILVRFQ